MSKNPNYTGLQTFSIPFEQSRLIKGDITKQNCYSCVADINAQSPKQNIANYNNVVPDIIRPKPENMVLQNNFLPVYNAPTLDAFNLQTEAKRRSQDSEGLLR